MLKTNWFLRANKPKSNPKKGPKFSFSGRDEAEFARENIDRWASPRGLHEYRS
jgi:hypothetical protein